MSYAATHIHDHSIRLYKTLEAETGLDPGFRVVGNLRMAQTEARMDEYRLYASTAETCGVPFEWLTPRDIAERYPLVRTEDLVGAILHPTDGYINPADVTQALAKGARARGVEIARRWQADAYRWTGSEWVVTLTRMAERGGNLVPTEERVEVTAEHVVTATGNHAQRTARLLGIKIPAIPVEHQYIVTEPDPRLVAFREANPEHPGAARRGRQDGMSARSGGAGSSGPTSGARPRASPTGCRRASARTSSRSTSTGSSGSTRASSTASRPPRPWGSRTTTTAPSATPPTATR